MDSILSNYLAFARRRSFAAFALTLGLTGPAYSQSAENADGPFQLKSATFKNHTTVPLSMIYNGNPGGANPCSLNGAPGADQSPELSWTNPPPGTHSFALIAFDTTASFTHWGIYNIASDATGLPQGAGAVGSTYGTEVLNDFYDPSYDGPCPPANVPPNVHHYVFTVYALASELDLQATANFPPYGETLLRALLQASIRGELLGSASLTGFYSATPVK
jgi:hypothetical protein